MIPARTQFVAAVVATLVGIAGLAGFGFHALDQIAATGARVKRDLSRLSTTAEIVDALRDLDEEAAGGNSAARLNRLTVLMARLRRAGSAREDVALFADVEGRVALARLEPTRENWFSAGEAVGSMEQSIIRRAQRLDAEENAESRSHWILRIGGGAVAIFGAASAIVFLRWEREQREAQDRLRRSDRLAALGTIAASVAHDINNPLATISGCATAVRDRLRRQPDACADSLEYMEMIEDETRRCSAIVKSLGDLARDGPPAMAPADLAKVARSVVALLEMDRKAKSVTYDVLGEESLEAICDPDKLKQLLLNLLINAREASAPGSRVTVRVERAGDAAARLEVVDSGRGIEKKDLLRIFEPFHTDKMQGLGIGLFLCERIASLHGGTIRAESAGRGRGAKFVVEIPTRDIALRTPGIVPAGAGS